MGAPDPLNRGLWTPADDGAALSWVQSDGAQSPVSLKVAAALDRGSSIAVELNGGSCRTEEFRDRITASFWDVPDGLLAYDRRFLDDVPVPLVVHTWVHPRFRLERRVRQWVPPGEPVQVDWSVTPIGTEPTPVRVRIMDDTPPGFVFNPDQTELVFDVQLNDGQTRTASYALTPSSDTQGEGNFLVLSRVSFEAADGSQLDPPVELESFVAVFDPETPREAGLPPHLKLALVDAKVEVRGSEFEVKATFSLDAHSDGIDPLTQEVSFTVGTFATSIPAGSLKRKKVGKGSGKLAEYAFAGSIDGVSLEVKLTQLQTNRFELKAEGEGAAVSRVVNPEIVNITIGNDSGNTVTAKVEN